MLDDFNLYPTFMEQEMLKEKAAQYNMSVNEFIIYILRRALIEKNNACDLQFSKEWYFSNYSQSTIK